MNRLKPWSCSFSRMGRTKTNAEFLMSMNLA